MLSQRFRHFSLAVLIAGLCALPAGAQNLTFDSVTCLNHSTGEAAAGSIQSGGIECSGLPIQPGDHIGVVLSGVAGGVGTPTPTPNPGGQCQAISEQEPNDETVQDGGTLASGTCLQIDGSTHTGYGDPQNPAPGFDQDQYLIFVQGVTSIELSGEATGPISFDLYDPQTNESLACTEMICTVPAGVTEVVLWIASQDAATYNLEVKAGGAGGPSGLKAQGSSLTQNRLQRHTGLR